MSNDGEEFELEPYFMEYIPCLKSIVDNTISILCNTKALQKIIYN